MSYGFSLCVAASPTSPTSASLSSSLSLYLLTTSLSVPSSCTCRLLFDHIVYIVLSVWPLNFCYWPWYCRLPPSDHRFCFCLIYLHLSIMSPPRSAEQSLDGIHKIYDSWIHSVWWREQTEKVEKRARGRGLCRWHGWIMTMGMIDSLYSAGLFVCGIFVLKILRFSLD